MKAYNLSPEELTDGPLAKLSGKCGYPSLRSVLNDHNLWSDEIDEIEQRFREELGEMQTSENN